MTRTPRNWALPAFAGASALLAVACGGDDTRQLDPQSLAMNDKVAPFYDDGELQLYETQLAVQLPIERPSQAQRAALAPDVKTAAGKTIFSRHPWVRMEDVKVQLSWTLTNLDKAGHNVSVLIDPWNEFGRYVPGITVVGDNAQPNLSGIEQLYELPGLDDSRSSRIVHVFTYEDMDELATDFATVINVIRNVQATTNPDGTVDDPRIGLVNHAFEVSNRSGSDPYTDKYRAPVVPGLLGFDLGLRTQEPANIAIEFTLELVDKQGNRVIPEDSADPPDVAPDDVVTLGG